MYVGGGDAGIGIAKAPGPCIAGIHPRLHPGLRPYDGRRISACVRSGGEAMTAKTSQQQHASEQAYAAFVLQHYGTLGDQGYYLKIRRAFVEAYPDLYAWFPARRPERAGRLYGQSRSHALGHVSYRARPYLYFLALHGYATFDWDWLISVPSIHIWEVLHASQMATGIEQLIEEAVRLGYNRRSSAHDLQWAIGRIFLHEGIWQVDQIAEAHCDALAEAVRRFGERADIDLFHGSAELYRQRSRKSYLTAIHRLKVVLYHRGQATTEPWKLMPKYAEPPTGKPRMLAVMERYLTVRRLTSRPGTITKLEVGLRRFLRWLDRTYTDTETIAHVTSNPLVNFAEGFNSYKSNHIILPLNALTTFCI